MCPDALAALLVAARNRATGPATALYNWAMALDPKLLEIIACPKCRGRLESKPDGTALVCKTCRLAYPIVDEIPNLIAEDAQPL